MSVIKIYLLNVFDLSVCARLLMKICNFIMCTLYTCIYRFTTKRLAVVLFSRSNGTKRHIAKRELNHFSSLVAGAHIVLTDAISERDLALAVDCFTSFTLIVPAYTVRNYLVTTL